MTNIQKLYEQLQEGKISKDFFVKRARTEYSSIVSPVNSYSDIVTILKHKRLITEGQKLTTDQILDRLNPYSVKYGIQFELSKLKEVSDDDLQKVKAKVAKRLQKDPNAYRDLQQANAKDILKADVKQEMQKVGKGSSVDKNNGMKKPKGFSAPKSNTSAPKSENRKGKPKGVKQLKEWMEQLTKEYTVGMEVETPKGMGTIMEVDNDTCSVDLGNGQYENFQKGVLDMSVKKEKIEAQKSTTGKSQPLPQKEDHPNKKIKEIVKKLKEIVKKNKAGKLAAVGNDSASQSLANKMGYTQTVPGTVDPL